MIAQKIVSWARKKPDHLALNEDGVATSYADFARMIGAAHAFLKNTHFPDGKLVIVLGHTFLEQWVIVLALRALGVDTVPVLNVKMAQALALRNISAIAATEKDVSDLKMKNPTLEAQVRLVSLPGSIFVPSPDIALPSIPDSRNGGYLVSTSGTTGQYKKVFFAGAHEEDSVRWTVEAFSFDEATVFHGYNFPLWTGIGGRTVSAVWYAGGSVLMTRESGFKGFFKHRPNKAILVPVMLDDLAREAGENAVPDPNFELEVSGGFLPLSLADRVVKSITPNVHALYGSSEVTALMRARFRTADDLHWLAEHKTTYEIVDENGEPSPTRTEGELRIKLRPFDCQGYLDDEAATRKFFRDGYFYPGDLAVRREDGRIRVLGRTEDVINLKGYKLPVAPVEDTLQRKLKAETVCLFSETDDEGESRVVVVVESRRKFSDAERAAAIHGRPGFENARFVVLEKFPRAEAGMRKVNRRELRKLVI